MKNAAAISAQLVDMRNVGAHKSLKLTLHVPEEQALKAIEVFGWPTGVNPVPVALARLVKPAEESAHKPPPARPQPEQAGAPRYNLSQRAALLCKEPLYHRFCEMPGEEAAAAWLRRACNVQSRSEITMESLAATKFERIYSRYIAWRDEPDLAGAAK